MVYTVTKIFGVDAVKTRVFNSEADAIRDIEENLALCCEDNNYERHENESGEIYFIVTPKETNPTEYIEFVLRRCEIR